ncbi:hypothetical protein GCM10008983_06510 [Lentibacillus halophilus]|uniref:Uncharacterized protein n=1 Tax=Lentibacillus halophilus TaxID=295065 RepID=A0ABN0Z473_9BACI
MNELEKYLKSINWKKEQYFRWKFNLFYDKSKPEKTEEELMKKTEVRTMNSFYNWEKSSEYKALLNLYMDYRATQDFEEIYDLISQRAKEQGNEKDIKLFLQLKKEIKDNRKIVKEIFEKQDDDDEVEDDDLEI